MDQGNRKTQSSSEQGAVAPTDIHSGSLTVLGDQRVVVVSEPNSQRK